MALPQLTTDAAIAKTKTSTRITILKPAAFTDPLEHDMLLFQIFVLVLLVIKCRAEDHDFLYLYVRWEIMCVCVYIYIVLNGNKRGGVECLCRMYWTIEPMEI